MKKAPLDLGVYGLEFKVFLTLIHAAMCLFSTTTEEETLRIQPLHEKYGWLEDPHQRDNGELLSQYRTLCRALQFMHERCIQALKKAESANLQSNIMRLRTVMIKPWTHSANYAIRLARRAEYVRVTKHWPMTEDKVKPAIAFIVHSLLPKLLEEELKGFGKLGSAPRFHLSLELHYVVLRYTPIWQVVEIILVLLKYGVNPNQEDRVGITGWANLLRVMWVDYAESVGDRFRDRWFRRDELLIIPRSSTIEAVTLFLRYGADLNAPLKPSSTWIWGRQLDLPE